MSWWQHFRDRLGSLRAGPALDALLAHADPSQPLAERVAWVEDLLTWVRRDAPAQRVKLLLQILERQPEARTRVGQALRSIVRDTQALDLFADTGLPRGVAFMQELMSRVMSRVLPNPPDTRDLADIVDRLFPYVRVADWLEQLDPEHASRIVALFQHGETSAEGGWTSLRTDLEDAMVQLADRICVLGSHREVRVRLDKIAFRDLPFQKLPPAVETLIARANANVPVGELAVELNLVRVCVDACDRTVDEVISHLEKTGVNTTLVYDIARLRAQLRRLELLLEAWATPQLEASRTLALLADLVRQNHVRRSVLALFRQNLQLLTRRIVERNAETGEHYVARNRSEYLGMIRSAAGGGAIMGATTLIKLLLGKLALAEFFKGMFFGLNYAGSFVVIQLLGFTVATKQPANTAPALARRMSELRNAPQMEALVDEVVFLMRSQIAAVFGNLALVIPATIMLELLWTTVTGHHLLDEPKAKVLLGSVSPLSASLLYAALTGGLLWLSSLIAAWVDNWFVLHHLTPALAQHRGWQHWLGLDRARRLASWLEDNIAGLAGNISLGFLLSMFPVVAGFFGLPLDVRHVTLSTGQVCAAFAVLGGESFWHLSTLGIGLGILGIGLLNILVSFGLALFVAIRARNVRGPERNLFFRALGNRIWQSPLSFVLPVGAVGASNPLVH
jgi:site-specific recombinase